MRIMKPSSLLLAAVFVLGCDSSVTRSPVPSEWQTIRVGNAFTFRAPPDLKSVPVQGVDSLVGKYASPTLEVTFDYGRYSDPMDREGYSSRTITVDGKDARLVTGSGIVAIHFPKVTEGNRLTMVVRLNGANPKLAEALLQSIDFPE